MHFSKNQDVTPDDIRLIFDPIYEIEGLKLMHMYELHE